MVTKSFYTGNSKTKLDFEDGWVVADLGSGHNPHPRANFLVDRYLLDNTERSGAPVVLIPDKSFVVGDGCAMPFKDKAFDFIICSHVIEHINNIDDFCSELNRISSGGYLECPSPFAETLRHAPNHKWFVANKRGHLELRPVLDGYPLGWFGKLFFSLYFYGTRQVIGRDVFLFALGVPMPFHYVLSKLRKVLSKLWILFKPLTYTRLQWSGSFSWKIHERR